MKTKLSKSAAAKKNAAVPIKNAKADIDRFYEIIFIVHPECEVKKTTQEVIKKYTSLFKKIEHSEQIGIRNLAHKMKKQITGFYFYMHVVCKLDDVDAFKKAIKLDRDILRYLVIRHRYNYETLKDMMTPKVTGPNKENKTLESDFKKAIRKDKKEVASDKDKKEVASDKDKKEVDKDNEKESSSSDKNVSSDKKDAAKNDASE